MAINTTTFLVPVLCKKQPSISFFFFFSKNQLEPVIHLEEVVGSSPVVRVRGGPKYKHVGVVHLLISCASKAFMKILRPLLKIT